MSTPGNYPYMVSLEAIYLRFFRRRKRTRQGKGWSYHRIRRAYHAAKKLNQATKS